MVKTKTTEGLKNKLHALAAQYETQDFIKGDPSWFMHQVIGKRNQETIAFIASCLSYGSRQVFMPRIQYLLDCSKGSPYQWIKSGKFKQDIPDDENCFYRLYTNHMMFKLLQALQLMYEEYDDMENYLFSYAKKNNLGNKINAFIAIEALCLFFKNHEVKGIVPKDTSSCCKRVCMFLRWMVRKNSPVDLGIWAELIDQRTLLIPLDTHVIQQAMLLGLLTSKSTTMVAARRLTEKLLTFFPEDPLKADFALFGYGVNQ